MCTQLLPVRALGKILFNNQIVEEHPVHEDGEGAKSLKEIKFYPIHDYMPDMVSHIFLQILHGHYHEQLPVHPSMEVQTPPPNC